MLRYYLDEDLMPRALVHALRERSIDVLTTREAGRRGTPDAAQLDFATAEGRVIVTRNLADFAVLHARVIESGGAHAGVLAAQRRVYTTGQYLRALQGLSDAFDADEMTNRFEFLGNWLH